MRLRPDTHAVSAGSRDKWVTIQARPAGDTPHASGFPKAGPWADLATVAMARADLEAEEDDRFSQRLSTNIIKWNMPYRSDMDPELVDVAKLRRLVYRQRVYGIISAFPVQRARGLTILTLSESGLPT